MVKKKKANLFMKFRLMRIRFSKTFLMKFQFKKASRSQGNRLDLLIIFSAKLTAKHPEKSEAEEIETKAENRKYKRDKMLKSKDKYARRICYKIILLKV